MPDTPRSVARRIRWIVVLIVFMLALAAVYMMVRRHRPPHSDTTVAVNVVNPAP